MDCWVYLLPFVWATWIVWRLGYFDRERWGLRPKQPSVSEILRYHYREMANIEMEFLERQAAMERKKNERYERDRQ